MPKPAYPASMPPANTNPFSSGAMKFAMTTETTTRTPQICARRLPCNPIKSRTIASAKLQIAADAHPEKILYAPTLTMKASDIVSQSMLKNSR